MARAEPRKPPDGRVLRSERTRRRLVEAVRSVVACGEDPTPERVAEGAGVSTRTLYRLFGDLPGLWEAVRVQMASELVQLLQAGSYAGDVRQRVRELVRRRNAAFEAMAPYRRWVDAREVHYPAIREGRETLDRMLRAEAAQALAPELAAGAAPLAPVVDSLLSYESWSYLRAARGLGPREVAARLETAVLRLVAPSPDPAAGPPREAGSRRIRRAGRGDRA